MVRVRVYIVKKIDDASHLVVIAESVNEATQIAYRRTSGNYVCHGHGDEFEVPESAKGVVGQIAVNGQFYGFPDVSIADKPF